MSKFFGFYQTLEMMKNFKKIKNETVLSRFNYLKNIFKDKVSLIHGKMSDELIIKNMKEFQKRKKMILISTTMVEVGINIPNATLMVIEEANKFGLAQLHQLRGRITRSTKSSNCILMHNQNLSELSLKRLLILRNSDDGFEISEKDMFLRGSGDFLEQINLVFQNGNSLCLMMILIFWIT